MLSIYIYLVALVRGQEVICSAELMHEIFDEEKMVLLYRFSLEIEKAKHSLDLNVGIADGSGDHVVPTTNGTGTEHSVGNTISNGGRFLAAGFNETGNQTIPRTE